MVSSHRNSTPWRGGAFALLGTLSAALAGLAAPETASAQFFNPFAGVFYGPYARPPAPYASRRAAAAILARDGCRIVGPVERRGPRIMVHGVNADGVTVRYFIDAYRGYVVSAWQVERPRETAAAHPDHAQTDHAHARDPLVLRGPEGAAGTAPSVAARRSPQAAAPKNEAAPKTEAPPVTAVAPTKPAPPARSASRSNPSWSTRRAVAPPAPAVVVAPVPAQNAGPAAPAQASGGDAPAKDANVTVVRPTPAEPILPAPAPVSPIIGAGHTETAKTPGLGG